MVVYGRAVRMRYASTFTQNGEEDTCGTSAGIGMNWCSVILPDGITGGIVSFGVGKNRLGFLTALDDAF